MEPENSLRTCKLDITCLLILLNEEKKGWTRLWRTEISAGIVLGGKMQFVFPGSPKHKLGDIWPI